MFAESVADFAVKEDVTYDGVVDIELETELILHAPDASSVHAHRAE
jgi:hypothetical protein